MAVSDKYVIRPHRPFRCLVWLLILLLATGTAQWFWHTQLSGARTQLINETLQLRQQLQESNQRFQALSESHIGLQQAETMHQAKTEQLENRLQQLQQRVIELNKELLFYQNITQGDSSSELQVRELQLRLDAENPALVRYRLVITQGENISEPITGSIFVETLSDETPDTEAIRVGEHSLNLRHVQVIEGSFELPAADAALPALIQVHLARGETALTSRRFEVKPLLSGGP